MPRGREVCSGFDSVRLDGSCLRTSKEEEVGSLSLGLRVSICIYIYIYISYTYIYNIHSSYFEWSPTYINRIYFSLF